MPKYLISIAEISYYTPLEIKALNVQEAEERYMQLLNSGSINVDLSKLTDLTTIKIGQPNG